MPNRSLDAAPRGHDFEAGSSLSASMSETTLALPLRQLEDNERREDAPGDRSFAVSKLKCP